MGVENGDPAAERSSAPPTLERAHGAASRPSRIGDGTRAVAPPTRRSDDQRIELILATASGTGADSGSSPTLQLREFALPVQRERSSGGLRDEVEGREVVVVLEHDGPEALLVAGAAVRRLPRGAGGEELVKRAGAGALAWRRERNRTWKRVHLVDHVLSYSEQLGHAGTVEQVYQVLTEFSSRIVGSYVSLLFTRESGGQSYHLRGTSRMPAELDLRGLSIPAHPRFLRPGLLLAVDARADTGAPFGEVAPLFQDTGAVILAHQPVGDDGVLILLERRRERLFESEDWDLLRVVAQQAQQAVQRIRLLEEVHQLSLTDPLTGLANRRHLTMMMEHSLAAARRGEPLAVAMIDLDGFKEINDRFGHLHGDRSLCLIARCLDDEARGSDLVARFGGDEFLVVMPGANATAAQLLLGRVRERLGGQISFSVGVAEFHPQIQTAEELIEEADRNLYLGRLEREIATS